MLCWNLREKHKKALEIESQAKRFKDEKRFDEAGIAFKKAALSWKRLNNERDYLWCMANHYYFEGLYFLNESRYEEAYSQFERSKQFFRKLSIKKQVAFCEARMYGAKANIERDRNNFADSAKLFFKAA